MGCHTWFYKKVNLSLEDATKKVVSMLENANNSANEYLLTKDFDTFSKESLEEWVYYNNRILSWIRKGWIRSAIYKLLDDGIYIKDKNSYYIDCDEDHDIFRIGGYPEDVLFSMDETLEFIEKNKDLIYGYHTNTVSGKNWKEQLEDFWVKYPDGNIHFG